jgi:cell division protein FtsL
MGRAAVVMGVLVVLAAMSLVTARYQARHLFIQNEQLLSQAKELDVTWRQLQLDRAEYSRNARVDQVARDQLQMIVITPSRTVYVRDQSDSSMRGAR